MANLLNHSQSQISIKNNTVDDREGGEAAYGVKRRPAIGIFFVVRQVLGPLNGTTVIGPEIRRVRVLPVVPNFIDHLHMELDVILEGKRRRRLLRGASKRLALESDSENKNVFGGGVE